MTAASREDWTHISAVEDSGFAEFRGNGREDSKSAGTWVRALSISLSGDFLCKRVRTCRARQFPHCSQAKPLKHEPRALDKTLAVLLAELWNQRLRCPTHRDHALP